VSGPTLKDAVEIVDAETGDDRPAFYGINCSHPLEFMPAIEAGNWSERVLEVGDAAQLGERMGGLGPAVPPHRHLGRVLWHVGDPPRRDRT